MSKRSRRAAPGDTSRAGTGSGATPSASPGLSGVSRVGGAAAGAGTARPIAPGQVPGAFGSRRAGSTSPTGTPRAGRRAQPVLAQRSFIERHRGRLIWGGILVGVVLVAAFVLVSSSQPAYACSIQLDPAPSASPGASIVGQPEDDMARGHVAVGTSVTYTYCPPASGKHYNAPGQGPLPPRFYGPDTTIVPQGWIHNLEHGGLVILYNCAKGCDNASLDQLRQLASTFPASPRCKIAGGLISPVIARFDQMKASFAAIVWDRVLFQDTLNTSQILEFFKNVGETTNPEQQCNPNASGSPTVSSNPASPEATNPAVNPAGSESPAASAPAPSIAPSGSPAPSGS